MSTLLLLSCCIFISFTYNYIIYRLEYKIPMENLRLHRINRLNRLKKHLNNRIDELNTKVFKKEKQKARAFKKIEKMRKSIRQIDKELHYLENYGEK